MWRKVKTYFKKSADSKGQILALGVDKLAQKTLFKAFGKDIDLICDNGRAPVSELLGDVPPNLILADFELFKNSKLRNQIEKDDRLLGVPLLLLADEGKVVPEEQLINLGVAGIINHPLDSEELKSKLGDIMGTFGDDGNNKSIKNNPKMMSIDNFDMKSLDEGLRNLNRVQEPPASPPPPTQKEASPNNDKYADELEKMLAEIDEEPTTEQEREVHIGKQFEEIPAIEQEEMAEMKFDEIQEDIYEINGIREPSVAPQEVEAPSTPFQEQDIVPLSASPAASPTDGTVEQWIRSIAEEKITRLISEKNFNKIIEDIVRSVVPQIAEELVIKEIEKIKKKII